MSHTFSAQFELHPTIAKAILSNRITGKLFDGVNLNKKELFEVLECEIVGGDVLTLRAAREILRKKRDDLLQTADVQRLLSYSSSIDEESIEDEPLSDSS